MTMTYTDDDWARGVAILDAQQFLQLRSYGIELGASAGAEVPAYLPCVTGGDVVRNPPPPSCRTPVAELSDQLHVKSAGGSTRRSSAALRFVPGRLRRPSGPTSRANESWYRAVAGAGWTCSYSLMA